MRIKNNWRSGGGGGRDWPLLSAVSGPALCPPRMLLPPAAVVDRSLQCFPPGRDHLLSHSETPGQPAAPLPKDQGSSPRGPPLSLWVANPSSFLCSLNQWRPLLPAVAASVSTPSCSHFAFFNAVDTIFPLEFCKLIGVVLASGLDPDRYTLFVFKSDRPGLESQPCSSPAVCDLGRFLSIPQLSFVFVIKLVEQPGVGRINEIIYVE